MAAESVGLEICYIGINCNNPVEVIELLGLTRLTFPITGMTLGWPDNQGDIKPRLPLQSVLYWETFDRASEDDGLRTYAAAMIAAGIYNARYVPSLTSRKRWKTSAGRSALPGASRRQ